GNQISGMVLELPTGHVTIEERLRRINITTGDLKRTRQAVAADKLAGLADWAPPSLLVLAGRLMSNPQAGANINVTNVPGPQFPLYSGGAQLLEVWPFAPLYPTMGLGVAIVSYNGEAYFGLTAAPGLGPEVAGSLMMMSLSGARPTVADESGIPTTRRANGPVSNVSLAGGSPWADGSGCRACSASVSLVALA